jgi:hypothetical protein
MTITAPHTAPRRGQPGRPRVLLVPLVLVLIALEGVRRIRWLLTLGASGEPETAGNPGG